MKSDRWPTVQTHIVMWTVALPFTVLSLICIAIERVIDYGLWLEERRYK